MGNLLLAKLIQSEQSLLELSYEKLPIEYTEALLEFKKLAEPYISEFVTESNKMVMEKFGYEENGKWLIKDEMKSEFNEKTIEILKKEIEIQVPKMYLSVIKQSNPSFAISAYAYSNLKNFILYE